MGIIVAKLRAAHKNYLFTRVVVAAANFSGAFGGTPAGFSWSGAGAGLLLVVPVRCV